MKAGKTPYEIRLDLLTLAYQVLLGQKNAECAAEQTHAAATDGVLIDRAPTTEEIVAEADKLNEFVSQSTDQR